MKKILVALMLFASVVFSAAISPANAASTAFADGGSVLISTSETNLIDLNTTFPAGNNFVIAVVQFNGTSGSINPNNLTLKRGNVVLRTNIYNQTLGNGANSEKWWTAIALDTNAPANPKYTVNATATEGITGEAKILAINGISGNVATGSNTTISSTGYTMLANLNTTLPAGDNAVIATFEIKSTSGQARNVAAGDLRLTNLTTTIASNEYIMRMGTSDASQFHTQLIPYLDSSAPENATYNITAKTGGNDVEGRAIIIAFSLDTAFTAVYNDTGSTAISDTTETLTGSLATAFSSGKDVVVIAAEQISSTASTTRTIDSGNNKLQQNDLNASQTSNENTIQISPGSPSFDDGKGFALLNKVANISANPIYQVKALASNTNTKAETKILAISINDILSPSIIFEQPTETSGTTYARTNIQINATASDSGSGLKNITAYLYNSSGNLINTGSSAASQLFVNFTELADGLYYFNATAFDNAGNKNSTETRNVTIDATSPSYSNPTVSPPNETSYSQNGSYQFNITWTDNTAMDNVYITFSNQNYSATNISSEYSFTISDLAAGTYTYTWHANDTVNNQNNTGILHYSIIQAIPACSLAFNPAPPQTYGTTINASCSCTNPESSAKLYRNNADVTAAENNQFVLLEAATHNYTCNATESQNYTYAENTSMFTINPATSSLNLTLNGTQNNITANPGDAVNISCSLITPASGILQLYNNGSLINSGFSPASNLTAFSAPGLYNITCTYPATQNYSSRTQTFYVNVVNRVYPEFSDFYDNSGSLADSGTGIFNVTVMNTNGTVWLEINGANVTAINLTGNVYKATYDFTSAGTYEYKWHAYGNGTGNNLNNSETKNYIVSASSAPTPIPSSSGGGGGGGVEIIPLPKPKEPAAELLAQKKPAVTKPALPTTLFDIGLEVLADYKNSKPGNSILFRVKFLNLGTRRNATVPFDVYLAHLDSGTIIASINESEYVETQLSTVKAMKIPEDAPEGAYAITMSATVGSQIILATDTLEILKAEAEIQERQAFPKQSPLALPSAAAAAAVAALALYAHKLRKKVEAEISGSKKEKGAGKIYVIAEGWKTPPVANVRIIRRKRGEAGKESKKIYGKFRKGRM